MSAPSWADLEALFHEALACAPANRAALLAARCAGRPDVQAEVEALLRSHESASGSWGMPSVAQHTRLKAGARVGPYELLAELGAGGMGEVYRAHDPKLGRDVAIKVLPTIFSSDAERLARFAREARMLAALSHPNIAVIHGIEDANGAPALILELIDGVTLAERLGRPMPLTEALTIARQIAEALEAAHEKGIIHRDLKPANIKITSAGVVKVLDFGLAKVCAPNGGEPDLSQSPTVTTGGTREGMILGTVAYMSPEQARGQPLDKRTDIWAFGCVLYEMLTGTRAFRGETVSETLADVIKSEPRWTALPPETPAALRNILRRCLEKDPRQRVRDIGDARIEMQDAQAEAASEGTTFPVPVVAHRRRERLAWAIAAVAVGIAALVAAVGYFRRAPAEPPPARFTIGPPEQGLLDPAPSFLTVSPDGSRLAFNATDSSGRSQLWIRALDSLTAQPLPGTDGATQPFWAADGRLLAFSADGSLKKIAVSGGPAQTLTEGLSVGAGGTWSGEGVVLFARVEPGATIQRVSAAGGAATPVTALDVSRQEVAHHWPRFLPDGKHFLYLAVSSSTEAENRGIYVGSLDSKERTRLLSANSNVVYAPPGYLLFNREGTLMAQPFDAERIQLTGEPVPVAEGLEFNPGSGRAAFTASENGVLAYRRGLRAPLRTLVWVSRNGAEEALGAPARPYDQPRLSPDGRRVALEIGPQIWVYDLVRETLTRLTFEGTSNSNHSWTPDGKRIAFQSNKNGAPANLWQLADGSGGPEQLTSGAESGVATSWSPDGQLLAFTLFGVTTQRDIWVLALSDRKVQPFLRTPFTEGAATFSPDGRWLAYVSNESGRPEIYVQPYPGPGRKWPISTEGGTEPVWSRSGRELFYRSGTKMMAVETTTQPGFSAGKPRLLFEGQYLATVFPVALSAAYDVSADSQRFLMVKQGEQVPTQINVVLNWTEELKRRAPAK